MCRVLYYNTWVLIDVYCMCLDMNIPMVERLLTSMMNAKVLKTLASWSSCCTLRKQSLLDVKSVVLFELNSTAKF